MVDDVVLSKAATIERCVERVREEYAGEQARLFDDITRQDAIVLNLQRACQAAIDLAMHLVKTRRLGVPQESRDAFQLLIGAGLLEKRLGERLKRMVSSHNVAVYDYQALNLDIVQNIITEHLDDFLAFAAFALQTSGFGGDDEE